MNSRPLISVIVPCYNQGKYINEALQSVYEQTHPNWECLIVNDGATDDTEKLALSWVNKDNRFKYFYQSNSGLSAARNKGLNNMSGTYVQFLDADDKIVKTKFEASLVCMPGADLVISNFSMFSNNKKKLEEPSFKLEEQYFNIESILIGWDEKFVIPIHCGLFKTSLFTNIRFNETLKAKEDWLMWLQVFMEPVNCYFLNESLALYRHSGDSMSQQRMHMNSNLIIAYEIIYDIISVKYKHTFYLKVLKELGSKLNDADRLLSLTRQSNSYKLGNFLLHPLRNLFKF